MVLRCIAHGNGTLDNRRHFLAVAVLATPMPTALSIAIAIISWVLLVCWVTICIRWDFFRWHWPFVPFEIEEQVFSHTEHAAGPCPLSTSRLFIFDK
jgi:hypothetical protein